MMMARGGKQLYQTLEAMPHMDGAPKASTTTTTNSNVCSGKKWLEMMSKDKDGFVSKVNGMSEEAQLQVVEEMLRYVRWV